VSIEPIAAHPQPGSVDPGRTPPVVNHGPRTQKVVALTFDADMTPSMLAALKSGQVRSYANLAILDILEERQVPATFFVTGMWAERYPSVLKRIAAEDRYEIANHTYRHAAYKPNCYTLEQLPRTEMTADARRTFDVLAPFGGNQTRYFRFPGLCHDSAALTALAPLGVTVVDGDVVSGDPFATAAAPIVRAVLERVQAGSIIILHITEANAAFTDEALVPILEGLAERGLRPVKLSELLGSVP
jgi:peptidoglycan/xylan/chitin deacetylase (PgdA/CDA1 family)